VISWGK